RIKAKGRPANQPALVLQRRREVFVPVAICLQTEPDHSGARKSYFHITSHPRHKPPEQGASNTFSRVIHDRMKRAVRNSHSEVLNNSAAAQTGPSENLAAAGTQTGASNPERVKPRTLTSPAACGPIAERTLPQEGRCIRSRQPRRAGQKPRPLRPMKPW